MTLFYLIQRQHQAAKNPGIGIPGSHWEQKHGWLLQSQVRRRFVTRYGDLDLWQPGMNWKRIAPAAINRSGLIRVGSLLVLRAPKRRESSHERVVSRKIRISKLFSGLVYFPLTTNQLSAASAAVRLHPIVSFVNFCSNVFALPGCLFEFGYLVDLYRVAHSLLPERGHCCPSSVAHGFSNSNINKFP